MQVLILIGSTFISEDMTCVAAGLLARATTVTIVIAVTGCFLGIYLGDLGLWLLGRVLGRRVLAWTWVARRLPRERIDAFGHWFDRRGWRAVMASRFMPGTRVAVYVAAGVVGNRPGAFMLWTLAAVAIWTPLVVGLAALAGPALVAPAQHFFDNGWIVLAIAAVGAFVLVRAGTLACTGIGRAKLIAKVSRLWRWEFWPTGLFYIPLYPWIGWLAIRHRGLTVATAANPGIPDGGVVGESKAAILLKLPGEWVLPFALVPPGEVETRLARVDAFLIENQWTFPLILKPDSGERGASVRLARDRESARRILAETSQAVLVQVYHPGPYEAGIFYYRVPGDERGRIFSITDKHFSYLAGDGRHTIEQLIWRHPRYRMQARTFLKRLGAEADRVPAVGESVRLAIAGNHCQGTLFRDGAHLITAELERAIDAIARQFDGFYFGRFDVRYADAEALKRGRDFRIVELNGVTSESTNIYDPSWSIFRAYATLYRQWSILFAIGAANRARGRRPTPFRKLLADVRSHYRARRLDPMAD